jgi:hypothetical protein
MWKTGTRAALIAAVSMSCAWGAGKTLVFDFDTALRSSQVSKLTDPAVRILWDEGTLPAYVERSDPDDYTRGSRFSGFPDSPLVAPHDEKCMEALGVTLAAMQKDARKRQYDAILVRSDDPAAKSKGQFACQLGYATDDVRLIVEFVVTRDFAAKLAANPPEAIKPPPRPASDNVVTFPISGVLALPEVKAMMSQKVKAHWGFSSVPAYVKRNGPQDFSSEKSAKISADIGCREAFIAALQDMIESATDDGYDAVIRIHSNLDEQLAPDESLFECRVQRRDARVSLAGTLVVLK